MRKGLFFRLAAINIKKNKQTYIPYILTSMFTIAMLYMMLFINQNEGIYAIPHSADVKTITYLGTIVIGIFSFIFLIYSNSFLMKRRQKEMGLYNILGLEKKHIGWMLFLETLLSFLVSLAGGVLAGILGSKLALLFLLKLLHVPAQFGFEVCWEGIGMCTGFYGVVNIVILLKNIRKVQFSRPIELLRGNNAGEREPKAKWLMALVGLICLVSGYYIAVTTESPLSAITLFFVAVLLVMAGTYLLFTAGSIAVLKFLKWKKSFYYKTRNFTAVSGMMYRMKQNAVGLANICILSTGVMLMISTTVCMNTGLEDMMMDRYPREFTVSFNCADHEEFDAIRSEMTEKLEEAGIPYENMYSVISLSCICTYKDQEILFQEPDAAEMLTKGQSYIDLIPQEEYERFSGRDISLSPGEVMVCDEGRQGEDTIRIGGETYQVKEWLEEIGSFYTDNVALNNISVIVTEQDFEELYQKQKEIYGEYCSEPSLDMGMDFSGTEEEVLEYAQTAQEYAYGIFDEIASGEDAYKYSTIRQTQYSSFYTLFGGLLFIGIFLGILFLMGTAMIIYYKQISEGYEDKERFEIMQKVGMSHKEVKASIHRQIIMVFFLPLLMAALHMSMAFPMVKRLLRLFGMDNSGLFAACTVITILVYAVIYGLIYALTARSYYKIVERK